MASGTTLSQEPAKTSVNDADYTNMHHSLYKSNPLWQPANASHRPFFCYKSKAGCLLHIIYN